MRYRQPLVLSFVPAVAALALLASGCGGSGNSPGVASGALLYSSDDETRNGRLLTLHARSRRADLP